MGLEIRECVVPHRVDVISQRSETARIDRVDVARALPRMPDELSMGQDPQMLRNRGSRHTEPGCKLAHRPGTLGKALEDRPPRRVGECRELRRSGVHGYW